MSDLFWLKTEQMVRLRPHLSNSHGKQRIDDRRMLSGIIFINRNSLCWWDTPKEYSSHKTLEAVERQGVFIRMMEDLETPPVPDRKMARLTQPISNRIIRLQACG